MADERTEKQRLALIYDPLSPDRSDLEYYASLVDEFGSTTVLDVGCGTGTFACMLAARGITVIGVDPDEASLAVARQKVGASRVTWVHGDISAMHSVEVDLITMTANVAQHIVADEQWNATLTRAGELLRPGGRLVFETRDPANEAWRGWTREATFSRVDVPGLGVVSGWVETTDTDGEFVTFGGQYTIEREGVVLTPAPTTLRFRSRADVTASLIAAGFVVEDVRDAPDRPGREFIFVAKRPR